MFKLVRDVSKSVQRPRRVSWYDPKSTAKTIKHPASVMVSGVFSGAKDFTFSQEQGGYNYITVLLDNFLPFWPIHWGDFFMNDDAHLLKIKDLKNFLKENNKSVFDRFQNWTKTSGICSLAESESGHFQTQSNRKRTFIEHQRPVVRPEEDVDDHGGLLFLHFHTQKVRDSHQYKGNITQ